VPVKFKINKTDYNALSDDLKKLYKESGDDYILNVEGIDDPGELRRARDREKQIANEERKKAEDLQKRLDEIEGNDARKSGDIKRLEESWNAKYKKREDELLNENNLLKKSISNQLIDSTASSLASKISTVPALMAKAIRERLTVEISEENTNPILKILDKDGNVSALTLPELEKEFTGNPDYKTIILASKASGGGALDANKKQGNGSGASLSVGADGKPLNLAAIPPKDLAAVLAAKQQNQQED
jgi:hypothetical protein